MLNYLGNTAANALWYSLQRPLEVAKSTVSPLAADDGYIIPGLDFLVPCAADGLSLIDNEQMLPSICAARVTQAFAAIVFGPALLWSAWQLSQRARGKASVFGQAAGLVALFPPLLILSQSYFSDSSASRDRWITVAGYAAAWLHIEAADGRVRVSSTISLIYWLVNSLSSGSVVLATSFGAALDRNHEHHSAMSWLLPLTIFLCNTTVLLLESLPAREIGVGKAEGPSYDTSNVFGRAALAYINPLLIKGSKEKISRADFPQTPLGLNSVNTYDNFMQQLSKFSPTNGYRVILAVLSNVRLKIVLLLLLDIAGELATYSRPLVLSLFLASLQKYSTGSQPIYPSIYFGAIYGTIPLIIAAFQNLVVLTTSLIYVNTRSALTALIYRKALSLGPRARTEYDSAKIMSLLNVDTEMIDSVANEIPTLISAPIALVIAIWQLYLFIGPSMFAALALYGVFLPYSTMASRKMYQLFPTMMKIRDRRTKVTSDAFRNMKSLKLYAWEMPFYERIVNVRNEELDLQRSFINTMAPMSAVWSSMGDLMATVIFLTYLYFQIGELTPEIIFPCLGLLNYITQPFMRLPFSITAIGKAVSSQRRINALLQQDDQDTLNYYHLPASSGFVEKSVVLDSATFSWNGDADESNVPLRNVSFEATKGDLVCITGRVGSGKTALLKAICNDIKCIDGSTTVKGSIAYCPQEPWLQNKTLKDNILFGRQYEEHLYKSTIAACDLTKDIEQLPKGDLADVGERGITLSGGQKARVALARAVYSCADVLVLDDVLSAVDEHVAAHLIKEVLSRDGVLAGKTIILATNNINVLSHASNIVALQDKTVAERVSFKEVVAKKDQSITYKLIKDFGTGGDIDSIKIVERKEHVQSKRLIELARPTLDDSPPALIAGQEEEEDDKGAVSLTVFKRYIFADGKKNLMIGLAFMIFSVVATNCLSIWLGVISNHRFSSIVEGRPFVLLYVALTAVSGLLIFFSQFWFLVVVAINVAKKLHNRMLLNSIRAPMNFFDVTPLGRIINRFTGDVERLDNTLSVMLYYFVRSGMNVIMCLLAVLIGAPFVILVVFPLAYAANYYRKVYVPASRQISRMAAAANSPILAHIEESVKGSSIIRAFDSTRQFVESYEYRADYWIDLNFLRQSVRSWLTWRIQMMTFVLDVAAIVVMLFLIAKGKLSIGFVGVVMYNSGRVGIMVKQTIFSWADLEVSGVSLDRILEYVDIKQEAPAHIPETQPGPAWPSSGDVEFKDLRARYRDDTPDVLKSLSFTVKGREKVGIVGRTGSGKSSLTLALFRIIEASGGEIDIDGVNTSTLGLSDLRSKLSIIPQDAQIFNGTLRENLDPFEAYTDERLWEILDMCHLKTHFEELEGGLKTQLSEGGANLSRGQAQLICLGRALLHEAKILVLDEATAAVDVETDKIVQETIRSQFSDRTILTIAHRLHTIADSDRILVLNHGEVAEFDSPANLLATRGLFYDLTNAGKSDELKEDPISDDEDSTQQISTKQK